MIGFSLPERLPPITDPLGRSWDQPKRLMIERGVAILSPREFLALMDYSDTNPTGVYEGKAWKRYDPRPQYNGWVLCWFAESHDPTMCRLELRPIHILDI